MVFRDFEFAGEKLSDFGFMVCSYDGGSDFETRTMGGDLVFNTVSVNGGKQWLLVNSAYEEALTATFYICPNPCVYGERYRITDDVHRWIMRWLNRPTYQQFRPLRRDNGVFYNGSFVVKAELYNGRHVGYELTLQTDRPFGFGELEEYSFNVEAGGTLEMLDSSDEIGDIYPYMELTCLEDGDLTITNSQDPTWSTVITGCTAGEKITFDHPIIATDASAHEIQQCFNYNFPRISNTYDDNENVFTFSLACSGNMSYNPIRKVGI